MLLERFVARANQFSEKKAMKAMKQVFLHAPEPDGPKVTRYAKLISVVCHPTEW